MLRYFFPSGVVPLRLMVIVFPSANTTRRSVQTTLPSLMANAVIVCSSTRLSDVMSMVGRANYGA